MNFIKANWLAMVAIVIAIVACFLPILPNGKSLAGSVSLNCNGTTTCLTDLYVSGGAQIGTDSTASSTFNGFLTSTGTSLLNDIVFATKGYSTSTTSSVTLSASEFCAGTVINIPPSVTSAITITLPAATSTYLACGSPALGSGSTEYIVNQSSVVVTLATTTGETAAGLNHGVKFFVASTTASAGQATTMTTPITLPASTSLQETGIYTATSTLWMMNQFFKML